MTSINLVSQPIGDGPYMHGHIIPVEINPNIAHAYFNRANLYKSYQKYNLAEEDYKTGLQDSYLHWILNYTCLLQLSH